jgi:hypothetical protein
MDVLSAFLAQVAGDCLRTSPEFPDAADQIGSACRP